MFVPQSFYTSDTTEIIGYYRQALYSIYLPNIEYKRAGVILIDIVPEEYTANIGIPFLHIIVIYWGRLQDNV